MNQSHLYVTRGGKSTYVEGAQRRAEAARLLHEAGLAQPGWLSRQTRSLARRAGSRLHRTLVELGESRAKEMATSA